MKKIFATILIALTAFCFTGCSLLGDMMATEQTDPNAYLIYAEMENLDDTYSTSFYLEIPEAFFLKHGVSTAQVTEALPALFAYEMVERPYGITMGTTALIGSSATWSDEDKGVSWVCEQVSENGAYCFQALMTFDDVRIFLDYQSKGSVLGTKSMFRRSGVVEGEGRFDESMIFTSQTPLYEIEGIALSEPMADLMDGWKNGYTDAGNAAFGAFWHGAGGRVGFKTALGANADAAVAELNEITYFCYQFASPTFNGANGQYDKIAGLRSGLWGYTLTGEQEFPLLAKMFFRSPRLWVWYLAGAILIALIGLFIFIMLRNNEHRRAARQTHRPYAAPFTAPVKPFEDYDENASPFDEGKTPFGDEYENKD